MGRIGFVVAFILGLLCYRRLQGNLSKGQFAVCALTLLAVIYMCLFVGFQLNPGSSPTAPSFRCVFLSWSMGFLMFFVPYFARDIDYKKVPFVLFLGKISYSIYLIHAVVLSIAEETNLSGLPFIAVGTVLSIGLATLSYKFIEKPGISFSHHLRQKGVLVS